MEAEADRNGGVFDDQRSTEILQSLTVADLLIRYRDNISVQKKGHEFETIRLNMMLHQPFAQKPLSKLSSSLFSSYREERLRKCQSETVRRELSLLHHVFEVALKEWSIPIQTNPISDIKKPSASKPRDRRLDEDEDKVLFQSLKGCRNKWIEPMARFAIETGMRRGELLALTWKDIDLEGRTLHIEHTKNGHPRTIPLSSEAIRVLRLLSRQEARVFPASRNSFKLAWKRAVNRSGVSDLRFHDLRHEAISRFFELGLSIPEVALISGHRDPRMLFRYTHLKAEDIVSKLT